MSRAEKIVAMTTFVTQGSRPVQEDCVLASQDRGIFAVADGFGGQAAGIEAARMACDSVQGFLVKEAGDRDATMPFVLRRYISLAGNVLFNALVHANRKVLAFNRNRNVHEKGGASVIAAYLDEGVLAIANVGACSAWLARDGQMVPLVIPRSYATLLDPFQKEGGAERAAPLVALGISDDLEPEIAEYRIRAGDWLLLHTDGLTAESRNSILTGQKAGASPAESIQRAMTLLKGGAYADNLAASLIIF